MTIEQQIEWLESVGDVFVLDCEPKQNLIETAQSMRAMQKVCAAADSLRYCDAVSGAEAWAELQEALANLKERE